ncbi:FecCD family ABC transporter permease [Kiloniella litopenaei]|uniref:FecCD family ABC transporter permease n=1 Tax=Kiloniella litopenaei TaxID=1549748 RepID=UPI003BAC8D29
MRNSLIIILLILLLAISFVLANVFGATSLDFVGIVSGSAQDDLKILWDIRLPRLVTGGLIGIHFAIAGALLQLVTRNALADPGLLGVSGGAILGMTIFILFEIYLSLFLMEESYRLSLDYMPLVALIGGTLGGILVFALTWKKGLSPRRFILIGITLSAFFHALSFGLILGWGPTKSELLWVWIAGSLYGASWNSFSQLWPWSIIAVVLLLILFRRLSLLRLDDDSAATRGLSVEYWRFTALLLACLFACTAVGVAGPVGFIGLVVPHLARRLIQSNLPLYFCAVFLIGANLAISADAIGRYFFRPAEIPVGIITSLIGAPVLFALLFPVDLSRIKNIFAKNKQTENKS